MSTRFCTYVFKLPGIYLMWILFLNRIKTMLFVQGWSEYQRDEQGTISISSTATCALAPSSSLP